MLGLDEVAVDDGAVARYHDVGFPDQVQQGGQLLRKIEREAARAEHGWPRSFDDVTDDPGLCVGNVQNKVGIGVPWTQRVQVDRATADVERLS